MISKIFNFDPIVFGRISNVLFIILSLLIIWAILLKSANHMNLNFLWGALALLIILTRSVHYEWAVSMRPDAMLLFLTLSVCFLICFHSNKVAIISLLTILIIITKQPGIIIGASLCLYYLYYNRKLLIKYIILCILFSALLIIPVEIYNNWNFILNLFIYENQIVAGDLLQWSHLIKQLASYYRGGNVIFFILSIIGLYYTIQKRTKILPLVFIYFIDILFYLKIGRNIGGGKSYLWLHWALTSIFSVFGIIYIFELIKKYYNKYSKYFLKIEFLFQEKYINIFLTLLFILFTILHFNIGNRIENYNNNVTNYNHLEKVTQKHQKLINELTEQNPGKKWYSERLSMAIVRAGNMLDQEGCTFEYAFNTTNVFDPDVIQKRFLSGEYYFIQKTGFIYIPAIEEIISNCYKEIYKSESVDRGRVKEVRILKYNCAE